MNDRTSENKTELIASKLRLIGISCRRRSEQVAGIQHFVAQELKNSSVKFIAARLGRQIDDASVESAERGRGIVCLHVEFANRIDDGEEGHLSRFRLQNAYSVIDILIRPR